MRCALVSFSSLCLVMLHASSSLLVVSAAAVDQDPRCGEWAEAGECERNPGYMTSNCAASCDKMEQVRLETERQLEGLEFFDLSANDIDGNAIHFDTFRGKVTIITNVASYCGYTESHYRGLVELHSHLAATEQVEILAFPCNQFGQQEPKSNQEIKEFAHGKGVEFTMMDKVNVNGPDASLVYKFLKYKAGPSNIHWNFATYFVIQPDGSVESFSGIEPMELKDDVLSLLQNEEL